MPPIGIEMSKDAKEPQEPVCLADSGKLSTRPKIILPSGYTAEAPSNHDLVRAYAEYHASYSLEAGVLSATRRFVIKKTEVELSSWEDYRDFGKAISDDKNQYVI